MPSIAAPKNVSVILPDATRRSCVPSEGGKAEALIASRTAIFFTPYSISLWIILAKREI
jgi:hypothetical protein